MKKLLVLLLTLVMLTGLVGCTKKDSGNGSGSGSNGSGESPAETVKVGVGSVTSISATDATAEKDGSVQINTTYAAVALDADGKIVYVSIDTAQNSGAYNAAGEITTDVNVATPSKKEKLADYGMSGVSEIGKEWFEQIDALEKYAVGKTVDELMATPVYQRDENHTAVPEVGSDLASSVTITIADYLAAVKKAADNAVAVEGVASVGAGSVTSMVFTSATAEKDGSVQGNTTYAVVALDADGKILYTAIDTAQNSAKMSAAGAVTSELGGNYPTKKEKGADYGMSGVSEIGKEWFEQIDALEKYAVGKTVAELVAIPVYERDAAHLEVPQPDSDLASSVTITIGEYLGAVTKANDNLVNILAK